MMKDAKERAELHRHLASVFGTDRLRQDGPRHTLHADVADLLVTIDDLERRLDVLAKHASTTERVERAEASIAQLRTELQQEREAREEMAALWRELWDRRHEP